MTKNKAVICVCSSGRERFSERESKATKIFLNLSKASSQVRLNRNNLVSPAHLIIWFLPFNCHIGPEFRLKPYVPTPWLPFRTVGRYCTETGMCHPDLLSPFSEQKKVFLKPIGCDLPFRTLHLRPSSASQAWSGTWL